MKKILLKIKNNIKKVALYASLFLAVFIGLFYLVNFDFSFNKKTISNSDIQVNIADDLKKKLGDNISFSLEGYGEWIRRFGLDDSNNKLDNDPDKDNLPNYLEYVHGTNPLNADTDGDKYTDKQEIDFGYDPDAFGSVKTSFYVQIEKLGVEAPMVWSKSENEKDMLRDLENGVSHYVNTATPGQNGNAIISGHSSNYIWAKGNYNYIFRNLNELQAGDKIKIKTIQRNGRVITYIYEIKGKYLDAPDDERIFETSQSSMLTLSTCWPLGTNLKRLIVKAELVR